VQSGFTPFASGELYVAYIKSAIVQQVIAINAGTATTLMSPNLETQSALTTTFTDAQANVWTISEL
jgi:hypothetical protein